jgi:hypothetical protein
MWHRWRDSNPHSAGIESGMSKEYKIKHPPSFPPFLNWAESAVDYRSLMP